MEDEEEDEELEREKRRALQAVFGESDDDDGGEQITPFHLHVGIPPFSVLPSLPFSGRTKGDAYDQRQDKASWEQVEGIRGLWLCRDFLSPELQSTLLAAIENEGWFTEETHNQAMRFGDLPIWASDLSDLIQEAAAVSDAEPHPIPGHLLWRDPLFDQLIVNVYAPGEGICFHVDLMRFEDGIAVVSLESPCVMDFSPLAAADAGEGSPSPAKIPVLLHPGSLMVLSGEARYRWEHGIDRRPGFQMWEGEELRQGRRTSITLRRLRRSPSG
ncbi:unnamed protein product [Spirodela intermedia]|uniref:Fe2OG dioxygenase domain-containing protein n=1 Tax=Spirodela intermedia TaxID=51605 RepID=A0A7I8KSJ1_SPIIN|nr:unnamed protein product [Spirodela intermedia]